jgi:hypothetical protein
MSAKTRYCCVAWALLASALVVALPSAHADTVTLTTGVSVTGNLVAAPSANGTKTVAVRTSTGGLIVFEKSAVKQVTHGSTRGQKSVSGGSAKPKLTAAEQAWIPRIHLLVNLLVEGDRDQSRRARAQLLKVQDPSAIPALNRHLANRSELEAQRLYVSIMKYMPAQTSVHYLVAVALFNPSADIREEARQAIGAERADSARALFIQALRNGDRNLGSRAAEGISEIGDANGDAVPYLIDRLVFREQQTLETSPDLVFTTLWQTADPVGPPPCWLYGHPEPKDNRPRPVITHWSQEVVPRQIETVSIDNVNSAVFDALLKVTDRKYPGFGLKTDDWRRWWATEKKNRDLNRRTSADNVISQSPEAHNSTTRAKEDVSRRRGLLSE